MNKQLQLYCFYGRMRICAPAAVSGEWTPFGNNPTDQLESRVDPQKSLLFVSILGAGLLCGTALAITIPEGVGLLEESWRGELGAQTPPPKNIPPRLEPALQSRVFYVLFSDLNVSQAPSS